MIARVQFLGSVDGTYRWCAQRRGAPRRAPRASSSPRRRRHEAKLARACAPTAARNAALRLQLPALRDSITRLRWEGAPLAASFDLVVPPPFPQSTRLSWMCKSIYLSDTRKGVWVLHAAGVRIASRAGRSSAARRAYFSPARRRCSQRPAAGEQRRQQGGGAVEKAGGALYKRAEQEPLRRAPEGQRDKGCGASESIVVCCLCVVYVRMYGGSLGGIVASARARRERGRGQGRTVQ